MVQLQPPLIDEALLTCAPNPSKPTGIYTQKDVGKYIKSLEYVIADCRANLFAVKRIQDETRNVETSNGTDRK